MEWIIIFYFNILVYGARQQQQQAYSLTRNKSDRQILRQRNTGGLAVDQAEKYPVITSEYLADSPEELGYVSDVCDYNVQHQLAVNTGTGAKTSGHENNNVVTGTLSIKVAKDDKSKTRKAFSDIETVTDSGKNSLNIVKPFPNSGKVLSEDESVSQYSRQSSVEDSKADAKSKRKSSGGKSSAIKNKIQMRKMMREANKMERPSGTLSDDHDNENDDGNDSVEEKQDSEPIVDEEIRSSSKLRQPTIDPSQQLTPETERRMKDWNSRFSNLKHSFDPASDREDEQPRLVGNIRSEISIYQYVYVNSPDT